MNIMDVREEMQDFLSETNKNQLPPWLLDALDSWCRSVFLGLSSFKYWDGEKKKNEEPVNTEVLKRLIGPYKEFSKFVTWLNRNF